MEWFRQSKRTTRGTQPACVCAATRSVASADDHSINSVARGRRSAGVRSAPVWMAARVCAAALSCFIGAAASGCEDDAVEAWPLPDGLLVDPLDELPSSLGEIGLFPQNGDLSHVPARVHSYAPNYPLWSNGLVKVRHIVVPEGQRVIAQRGAGWLFPTGTLLFKTFAAMDADWPGGLRPVETRVMRRSLDGWDFAVYVWDAESADAAISDERQIHELRVDDNRGTIEHAVPNTLQCRKCHESAVDRVLGFSEVQLAGQQGPASELFARGVVDRDTFAEAEPITGPDALTESVLQYFQADCVHCHNDGDGPASSFDLRPATALANIVGVETASSGSASGIRVVPGDPEASILYQAVRRASDNAELKFMPLIGVQVVDEERVETLRQWIESLQ